MPSVCTWPDTYVLGSSQNQAKHICDIIERVYIVLYTIMRLGELSEVSDTVIYQRLTWTRLVLTYDHHILVLVPVTWWTYKEYDTLCRTICQRHAKSKGATFWVCHTDWGPLPKGAFCGTNGNCQPLSDMSRVSPRAGDTLGTRRRPSASR